MSLISALGLFGDHDRDALLNAARIVKPNEPIDCEDKWNIYAEDIQAVIRSNNYNYDNLDIRRCGSDRSGVLARRPRLFAAGLLYHVIVRGGEQQSRLAPYFC